MHRSTVEALIFIYCTVYVYREILTIILTVYGITKYNTNGTVSLINSIGVTLVCGKFIETRLKYLREKKSLQ